MAAQPPNYGEYGDMMTLRTLGTVLLAAAFLALSACQSGTGVQRSDAPDASFQQRSAPAYVLGNGDRLRVTVFGHPDLSGEFDVDGTGAIRALVGGRDYAQSQFNRAVDAKRHISIGAAAFRR